MSQTTYTTPDVLDILEDNCAELLCTFFAVLYKIDNQQLRIPERAESYEESDKPVRFYARRDEGDIWTLGGRYYAESDVVILLPMSHILARMK